MASTEQDLSRPLEILADSRICRQQSRALRLKVAEMILRSQSLRDAALIIPEPPVYH